MTRDEIIATRIQEHLKLERRVVAGYHRLLNDYANRAAKTYEMTGSRVAAVSELLSMPSDVEAAIAETHMLSARRFYKLTKGQLAHLAKQDGRESEIAITSAVLAWIIGFIDSKVDSIVLTTRTIINGAIESAEQAFLSADKTAEEVRVKAGGAAAKARAEAIAATETHAAANFASQKAAEDMQSLLPSTMWKEWASAEDARVRPDHSKSGGGDGQIVKLAESFLIGGSRMRWPGDPLAPLEQIIRCRCTVLYHTEHPKGLV